ncbi:hypothetical protein ULG90_05965 [Halopseudomonas pachastrellae]|nr:hypothetical protein ULG90_05965 [Halopseudomonas pachastrellae]
MKMKNYASGLALSCLILLAACAPAPITGAAGYRAWLSRRNALHPVTNRATDQRPPAD